MFVTLAPEELRSIAPSSDIEITAFVRLPEIDPVYFEAFYYVKPKDAGRKPYAPLYEAMREAGFGAMDQFAMHHREQLAVSRPGPAGLLAHTMYFAAEVIEELAFIVETDNFAALVSRLERYGGGTPLLSATCYTASYARSSGVILRIHTASQENWA